MGPRVLFIGDRDFTEFRDAAEWLQSRTEVLFLRDVASAEILDFDPQGIVIAQMHPGVFRTVDIELIHRTAPLAPMLALLGPWCEGEVRTGRPWPGVPRVYWHQWRPRFERCFFPELSASSPWSLPKSVADTEQLSAAPRRPKAGRQCKEVVVDCAAGRFPMLVEALSALGFDARSAVADSPPREDGSLAPSPVFLLEVAQFGEQGLQRLRRGAERWRPRTIIVSSDFVRVHEVERWRESGTAIVLARPWLLDDLAWCVEHADELVGNGEQGTGNGKTGNGKWGMGNGRWVA